MLTEDFQAIARRLEPGASAGSGDYEPLLISIAISLKRIADHFEAQANQPRPSIFEQAFGRG